MLNLKAKLIQAPPSAAEIIKQVNFGTVVGITRTGVQAQTEVLAALSNNFTIRNKWATPGNMMGINLKRATPQKPTAEIYTRANWLKQHEEGANKTPVGNHVAVPTWQMRPKGSNKILKVGLRPRALLASGKAFILKTDKGPVIAQMVGKSQRIRVLYGLEPQVRIKKRSVFYEPIQKVVKNNLRDNIKKGIADAFKNSRNPGKGRTWR